MLTKITRQPFNGVNRESKVLDLIHSDLCDFHANPSFGHNKYVITFIDDASRYCYVYLLHAKHEALDKFKIYKQEVELQRQESIKVFRTDRGGEYYDPVYFQSTGIIHQTTAPYTPQQNGVAERKNRTLKEMVNSMLSYSVLSEGFWGEAMLTACYILNRTPNKNSKQTPYEIWTKKVPNLTYLRVWGCRAVVRLTEPKMKILGEKGIDCIFIGYAEHSKCYRFYVIEPNDYVSVNSIIESKDAISDEERFTSISRPRGMIQPSSSFVLHNVRYIPELKRNLISLETLEKEGYTVKLQSGKIKVINGSRVVLSGTRRDNCIYSLDGHAVAGELNASVEEKDSLAQVWHKRLGHISEAGLQVLEKQGLFGKKSLGKLNFCENCVLKKSHRVSFGVGRHTTQGVIDYVHSDLWGLSQAESLGGKRYFLSIVDDYSKRVWVYLLRFKHEAFEKFKEYKQL
uniref:Zinc finger, CCHC-type n=1 Tax=Tanacetum cinerariifolium TaxID=118510 RepID=A0A6L2KXX6_TANCI|nr:zinc finger, CCHC-type [Tanacetum cinerariifolium]